MWIIAKLINNTSPLEAIYFSDGKPVVCTERDCEGTSYRLIVNSFGFLDFTDTGHQLNGKYTNQLVINGNTYYYNGDGAITLIINSDGSYTVTGNSNEFSGKLTPLPSLSQEDLNSFKWMMKEKFIPYQNIPDEPGKTNEELKKLGLQYFPYSNTSFELAMSLYNWTTADFTRIAYFSLFAYTGVDNYPLDMDSIANAIWAANWGTYIPQDKYYMNSFMMVPAYSLEEVQKQLEDKVSTLYINNIHERNVIHAALQSMPRTSCYSKPKLFSGQVDISSLSKNNFATYFFELPANSSSELLPLQMDIEEALNSFIAIGNTVTLKTFMAFTDNFEDAKHYSNGILIILTPLEDAVVWDDATYITPLSDGPTKTEYLIPPKTQFKVLDIKYINENNKDLVVINLQVLGRA